MSGTSAEREAAAFAASLDLGAIPAEALDRATLVVADSIGAILGGSTAPYAAAFAERSSGGPATVLGTDRTASATRAALANGGAGTVLELDEGHKYSAGHPAMHVLPAVLAVAEAEGGDEDRARNGTGTAGRRLLTSFVAGYEVAARVGIACTPLAPEYHMHGVWGTVGAAAGVSRFREYDERTTLAAMRIGANHALHTRFDAATEGATVRNTYAGMSAMNGILAADQAAAGFTGLDDGLARHLDRLCADGFDRAAVADALGERWEITRGYFKNHAACRYTHGALDALDAIEARGRVDPDTVASVRVETYPDAARLTETRPENDLEAKFSIPFAVATRLRNGDSSKASFAEGALTDEAYGLAERISVTAAEDLAERVPEARSTRVIVEFEDGTERTEEIRYPKGDERNPLSTSELREKFQGLAAPVVGEASTEELWELARGLPDSDPRALCEAARP
ncbi:MmgE/PrpD family protein [Salinirubellus sp. GCM10025818]|uniref:MmgE/PrpD family protein n=1 Tax=Salinirubellus TaxID=2162630 RepID=UPI0030D53812